MKKLSFKPKLLPTLATLLGLALLLALGTWQLGRYHEKLEREAEIAAREDLPALALKALPSGDTALEELNYRSVTLRGELDMRYAVLFKHRQLDGRPGYWLAAPLVTADRRAIWTNLGWLPFKEARSLAEAVSNRAPSPSETYQGLLYLLPQNIEDTITRARLERGELELKDTLSEWHTYDIEALLESTPYEMGSKPAVLVLDSSHSGEPYPIATTESLTKPYMTSERHQGYFLFWYSTAGALLLLYLGASFGLIGSFQRPGSFRLRQQKESAQR